MQPAMGEEVSGRIRNPPNGMWRRDASAGFTPPYAETRLQWPTSRMCIRVQEGQQGDFFALGREAASHLKCDHTTERIPCKYVRSAELNFPDSIQVIVGHTCDAVEGFLRTINSLGLYRVDRSVVAYEPGELG